MAVEYSPENSLRIQREANMSDNSILPVWTEQFRVRHTEVTREGFLRADVFFDYMQEAAANHAKHIGVGLEALNSIGLMWVLSRLKLQVLHTPLLGETISVTTWPSGIERLFATREFILKNENEEIVARASSCWILLDQIRMHPRKVLETLPAKLPDNSARERNFTNLEKLPRLPVSNPSRMRIPESMIDVNRHMNNARYVTEAFDWLAETRRTAPRIAEIQVNFLAGTAADAVLETAGTIDGNRFYVESSVGTAPHFQASGTLQDS